MNIDTKVRKAIAATKLAVKKSRGNAKSAKWSPVDDLELLLQLKAELKILKSLPGGPLLDLLAAGGSFRLMGINRQVSGHSVHRKCRAVYVFRNYNPEKPHGVFSGNKVGIQHLVAHLIHHLSRKCDDVTSRTKFREPQSELRALAA